MKCLKSASNARRSDVSLMGLSPQGTGLRQQEQKTAYENNAEFETFNVVSIAVTCQSELSHGAITLIADYLFIFYPVFPIDSILTFLSYCPNPFKTLSGNI